MPTTTNHTREDTKALPLTLSHIADFRYPGEEVVFRTQIDLIKKLSAFSLRVILPQGIKYVGHRSPSDFNAQKVPVENPTQVVWNISQTQLTRLDFQVMGRILSLPQDQNDQGAFRESSAKVFMGSDEDKPFVEESTTVMPVVLSHVADFYRRYSGERLVYHTRIKVLKTLPNLSLEVELPPEVTFRSYQVSNNLQNTIPWLKSGEKSMTVIWDMGTCKAGSSFDYEVEGEIIALSKEKLLKSQARLMLHEKASVSASVTVQGLTKSDYLRYLPGIYQEDELMGRFLMLFESFWKPIEQQIDHIPFYFDPQMTTSALLPWLASVLNLDLNPHWPEKRKRELLSHAATLYRKRGTKEGLKEYLEICTGGEVEIIEYQGQNMVLGSTARLGAGIALGKKNRAYTFTVTLHLSEKIDQDEQNNYRRRIHAMIDAQRPAYTEYELDIKF